MNVNKEQMQAAFNKQLNEERLKDIPVYKEITYNYKYHNDDQTLEDKVERVLAGKDNGRSLMTNQERYIYADLLLRSENATKNFNQYLNRNFM